MAKIEAIDFAVWFSGMKQEEVEYAYNIYFAQNYVAETEEEYNEGLRESKYELPMPPAQTAKKLLEKKDREIKALKDEIARIVYISEQPGGYHP